MPAEWEPQEAVWMSWPVDPRLWPGRLEAIQGILANLAAALARHINVRINADPAHHAGIRRALKSSRADTLAIELFPHPTNDVWCRDHGPTFVRHRDTGEIALVDWTFNAWGEKFEPHNLDNEVPQRIAESLGLRRFPVNFTFEGGGLEADGEGRILTTESVALNPNRNPGIMRSQADEILRQSLGADEIIWLPSGLEGDDTDGHIDTLTRFTAPGTLLTAVEPNRSDPNHAILEQNKQLLIDAGLEVIDLPQPPPIPAPSGWRESRLPGTYANFLITNGAVLAPVYGFRKEDDHALGILRQAFPGHKVTPFDCREILLEGGAIHCLTQQQPAATTPQDRA